MTSEQKLFNKVTNTIRNKILCRDTDIKRKFSFEVHHEGKALTITVDRPVNKNSRATIKVGKELINYCEFQSNYDVAYETVKAFGHECPPGSRCDMLRRYEIEEKGDDPFPDLPWDHDEKKPKARK